MQAPVDKTCTGTAVSIRHYENQYGRISYPENNPTNFGYIVNITDVKDAYTGQAYDDFEAQVYAKVQSSPPWFHDNVKIKFLVSETKSGKPRIKNVVDMEKQNDFKKGKEEKAAFTSSYNDPISIKKSAFSAAQDIAIAFLVFLDKKPKDVYQLNRGSELFYSWIINDGKVEKRDDMINRFRSLEKAIKISMWMDPRSPEELIELAEQLLHPVTEIDVNDD